MKHYCRHLGRTREKKKVRGRRWERRREARTERVKEREEVEEKYRVERRNHIWWVISFQLPRTTKASHRATTMTQQSTVSALSLLSSQRYFNQRISSFIVFVLLFFHRIGTVLLFFHRIVSVLQSTYHPRARDGDAGRSVFGGDGE